MKLAIATALAALPFLLAAPAQAQTGTVKSQHGAWAVVCDQPAGAAGEQCALLQNVVAEDRPEVGLSVLALKTADGKARILRVLAPLGILLPNGWVSMSTARTSAGRSSCDASRTAAMPR